MLKRKQILSAILAASLMVGLLLIWISFAPIQVGGPAGYIIVNGNSMEPVYQRGDLVLTLRADQYAVGDIVAYRHPRIGLVIHRIVGEERGHFILKGDHNTWLDSYRPTTDEVVGVAWQHLPRLGNILIQLRSPAALASLTVVLTGLVALTTLVPALPGQPTRQGGRRTRLSRETMKRLGEQQEALVFTLSILGLVSMVLGAAAFSRPLTQTIIDGVAYEHRGEFNYTADAPPDLYDTSAIETGDPIFRRLTNSVRVDFMYNLAAQSLTDVNGSYRLIAELSDSVNNWTRTVELQPTQFFTGNGMAVSGVLDLNELQTLVTNINALTGVTRQSYIVTVIPEVTIHAQAGDQPINDVFAPRLTFQVNDLEMYLASPAIFENGNPLKPVLGGVYQKTSVQPNTLPIFSFGLDVMLARVLALVGLALTLVGAVGVFWFQQQATRQEETELIAWKYSPLLVTVDDYDLSQGRPLLAVKTFDELARLAEREGRMILHRQLGDSHEYYVQDSKVTYSYGVNNATWTVSALSEGEATVSNWLHALTLRNIEDQDHLLQTADLTERLAARLGVLEQQRTFLRWGVLVHDVGKLTLPDQILFKTEPLNETDWQSLRNLPSLTHDMLATVPSLRSALDIPQYLHERWDGSGYPQGLKEEAIPLAARIFAVVNVWQSMQASRPYRPALSLEEANQFLLAESGKQFDPQIVQTFLTLVATQEN